MFINKSYLDDIDSCKAQKAISLDLSNRYLFKVPSSICELVHLEILDLSSNELTHLPKEIVNLKNLEIINLQGNKFKSFPPGLKRLKKLRKIYFADNSISDLPEGLDVLDNLEVMDFMKNNIKTIPYELIKLNKLKIGNFHSNPIENVPKEIVLRDIDGIKNYLSSIYSSEEKDYLYEAKLILVGRGGRGKTSIVKRLIDPNSELGDNIKTTEGIEISEWYLNSKHSKKGKFRFNIWDFGGQEKYDSTHQFFLTKRSLYFFVTESRNEDNYLDFDFWLNMIKLRGDTSPVIIVQNKIDIRDKNIPTKKYLDRFENIVSFIKLSCAKGYEYTISNLLTSVHEAVRKLPQLGDELPKSWVDIRRKIEELLSQNVDYIDIEEYIGICKAHSLSSEQSLFLSQYFHDLGIIIHHQNDIVLKNTVFINPDWTVDGVYKILDSKEVENTSGKFTQTDLIQIWNESRYSEKIVELLQLMKNYELCFELDNKGNFIVPELLPADPPETLPKMPIEKSIWIEYRYDFFPSGIITRFIVRTSNLSKEKNIWRYGVHLFTEDSQAQIIEDDINRTIKVLVSGKGKRELLAIIRNELRGIHDTFEGLKYSEMIAVEKKSKIFKSYDEVKVHAEMKRNIFIYELRIEIDPQIVLGEIIPILDQKKLIKKLISKNKIVDALDKLEVLCQDDNILLLQINRFRRVQDSIMSGTISFDEIELKLNKLVQDLLMLIDKEL